MTVYVCRLETKKLLTRNKSKLASSASVAESGARKNDYDISFSVYQYMDYTHYDYYLSVGGTLIQKEIQKLMA